MTSEGYHVALIDGSTYIHRAYHAAGNGNGQRDDAVAIFRRMLEKLLGQLSATHIALVLDAPGKTFRNELYANYKATRQPVPEDFISQLPGFRETVRALDLPIVEQAGVEADNVIATYARMATDRGATVTIVASDKDLMQLVTDRVTIYDPYAKKQCHIGVAEVIKKFGVPPKQVIEVQALAGDASDNVPGVPGIGIKIAAKLIAQFGDLETLLDRAGEIEPKWRKALLDNAEEARLSRRLVLLDDAVALDVPLEALAVHKADAPGINGATVNLKPSSAETHHPALNAYVRRIGAVQKNFRRYVIEEKGEDGYACVTATIRIDDTITCDVAEFEPTKEEQKAIKEEIEKAPFPKSIKARKGPLPAELRGVPKQHLCIFLDQSGDHVLMIQHRRDGEKPDYPYTLWNDGRWRCMEPEGLLPLYGLEKLKQKSTFFIHEGAKAARDISAMVNHGGAALAAHPWGEELKQAAHLGWPGGARNARRVDWEPIRNLPPADKIILVCDHDQVGIEAATVISEKLRRPLLAVMIDDRFPAGFDLADPWPTKLEWWEGKKYVGPTFDDCLIPATWATDIIPPKEKGRPTFKVTDQFAAEWYWVTEPPVFVHRSQSDRLLKDDAFNRGIRPFSHAENTARLLIQKVSSQCDKVIYEPGEHPGAIHRGGKRFVNCYRPSTIKAIKGNTKHFERFMKHLVPDEGDRRKLMRWIATLIARPDIRMTYGVLLISIVHGVGKTTLGEAILTPLLGEWNVSFPTEQQIVDSEFNSWLVKKRLAVVHEIYSGHSVKAYNRLKSAITDGYADVNEKFLPVYRLDLFIHILACSNSPRALHIDDSDRRWLVPRITEKIRHDSYWKAFHRWLRVDGLGIIKTWAEQYVAEHGPVLQGEHAPETSLKKEIIAEGRSEGERLAFDLGLVVKEKETEQKIVLAMEDVRNWVAEQRKIYDPNDRHLEKSATLRKAMIAAGLREPKAKGEVRRRFRIRNAVYSYVVANFEIGEGMEWTDLREFYVDPEALKPLIKF